MGNAAWLFWALPAWFLSSLVADAGPLSIIPLFGIAFLIGGVVTALRRPNRGLWLMVIPVAACQLLVTVAGAARGTLTMVQANWVLGGFFWGMLAVTAALAWLVRGARPAAAAFGTFAASYVFFTCFVAGMAFTDTWL